MPRASSHNAAIKRSPFLIVQNLIALQILLFGLYLFAGSLTHYARIYRTLPWADTISFEVARAAVVFGIEFVLAVLIFMWWQKDQLIIGPDKIIHGQGIIYERKSVIPLQHIGNVSYRQGPIARLIRYGTLELENRLSKEIIKFGNVPDPQEVTNLILRYKRSLEINGAPTILADGELDRLAGLPEGKNLEFKTTFRWDLKANKVNKIIEKGVIKTIAAFLNSDGGYLIIGMGDDRKVIGLEHDYKTLGRSNADGFKMHFSHLFNSMIGPEFRQYVNLSWYKVEDKDCCLVNVAPTVRPAFVTLDGSEEFYIRTGNGTTSLKMSAAYEYIRERFM